MDVLAEGWTAERERWALVTEPDSLGRYVGVEVTAADGHRYWGTGCILPDGPQTEPLNLTTGGDHEGPTTLTLALRADVRAVVVWLSDGTREDLSLYELPGRPDLRLAALVHPRRLDVHRIDLYDATGTLLSDT